MTKRGEWVRVAGLGDVKPGTIIRWVDARGTFGTEATVLRTSGVTCDKQHVCLGLLCVELSDDPERARVAGVGNCIYGDVWAGDVYRLADSQLTEDATTRTLEVAR
jgi:hypothetical protein